MIGRPQIAECSLFAAVFVSFAYFHQGGGWPQNARFGQLRAIVEEHRFAIDSFLIYRTESSDSHIHLRRLPIRDGMISVGGVPFALAWTDAGGAPVPLQASQRLPTLPLVDLAVTGDVTFVDGHLYPNKAPGGTFLALPAYALLFTVEWWLGHDPDDWWVLTINAWLTTVLSVGLVSALGCIIFFRASVILFEGHREPALLATLAFAWGTIFFPYATMAYEHNVVAVALLAAFWLVLEARTTPDSSRSRIFWAGVCAGYAGVTNYLGLPVAGLLAAYVLWCTGGRRFFEFVSGMMPPLLVVLAYDWACFGSPWMTSYGHENPTFHTGGLLMNVFGAPRLDVLLMILASPYRGLFYGSPVLAIGLAGWVWLFRRDDRKPDVLLFAAILLFFLAFNVSFNGWHGGWCTGPRYLLPAVPFLALGMTYGFTRFPRVSISIATLAAAMCTLATVVDPQPPTGQVTILPGQSLWQCDAIRDYQLPLFLGAPEKISEGEVYGHLIQYSHGLAGLEEEERTRRFDEERRNVAVALEQKDWIRLPLTARHDPVSVNPTGTYQAWGDRNTAPDSLVAQWNSFNVGELLFPRSRWSLLPLVVVAGALALTAFRLVSPTRAR